MGDILNFKPPESNHEEHSCPDCDARNEIVSIGFHQILDALKNENMDNQIDGVLDALRELYIAAHDEGRRNAYFDLIGYAGHNIDEIDSAEGD
jgi:hypothetical protein